MNALARRGTIRWFGCSDWGPGRSREAQAYAAAHGLQPFVASQIFWNLAVPNPGVVDLTLSAEQLRFLLDGVSDAAR